MKIMDFEALYLEEKKQNAELLNEIRLLREQVEYLTKKLFGSHSEKTEASGHLPSGSDRPPFRPSVL